MPQIAEKKGKNLFELSSNPELDEMVQKEFDAHPEGLTIDEMCEIIRASKILKRFNMYRVMRSMVELGMAIAPYQKDYRGRSEDGCPYPFAVNYTLPRLFDVNIKTGMKSFIRPMLEDGKILSAQELKKEFDFDPSDEDKERLFAEALKELEDNREIRSIGSSFQGPEKPLRKATIESIL